MLARLALHIHQRCFSVQIYCVFATIRHDWSTVIHASSCVRRDCKMATQGYCWTDDLCLRSDWLGGHRLSLCGLCPVRVSTCWPLAEDLAEAAVLASGRTLRTPGRCRHPPRKFICNFITFLNMVFIIETYAIAFEQLLHQQMLVH